MRKLRRLAWVAMLTVPPAAGLIGHADSNAATAAIVGSSGAVAPAPTSPTVARLSRLHHTAAREAELGRLAQLSASRARDAGVWCAAGRGFPGARRTDLGARGRARHRRGKPRARPRGGEHRCARPGEGRPRPTHGGARRRLRPAVLGCRRTGSARGRGHAGGRALRSAARADRRRLRAAARGGERAGAGGGAPRVHAAPGSRAAARVAVDRCSGGAGRDARTIRRRFIRARPAGSCHPRAEQALRSAALSGLEQTTAHRRAPRAWARPRPTATGPLARPRRPWSGRSPRPASGQRRAPQRATNARSADGLANVAASKAGSGGRSAIAIVCDTGTTSTTQPRASSSSRSSSRPPSACGNRTRVPGRRASRARPPDPPGVARPRQGRPPPSGLRRRERARSPARPRRCAAPRAPASRPRSSRAARRPVEPPTGW